MFFSEKETEREGKREREKEIETLKTEMHRKTPEEKQGETEIKASFGTQPR